MCWSMGASAAMVVAGSAATAWSLRRGEHPAIPATFAYFTVMEGLQAAAYPVVDQCGSGANQALTLLSYLHITFQPFFINAFAIALIGNVSYRLRIASYAVCFVSAALMLLQLYPFEWAGACAPGTVLCGERLCLVSGAWHIAWGVPYNGLIPPIELLPSFRLPFPSYMVAVFVMPLFYGGWRFVLYHALAGPILASVLAGSPNEMPAIWCLFSVGLVAMGLSPWVRRTVSPRDGRAGPGAAAAARGR